VLDETAELGLWNPVVFAGATEATTTSTATTVATATSTTTTITATAETTTATTAFSGCILLSWCFTFHLFSSV
jgi:hypothetical protein